MRLLPVLLTRPEADARAVAQVLRAMGATVVLSPLMQIEATGMRPDIAGGVLLTSRNAVRMFAGDDTINGVQAWVVGPQTAELARDAGFRVEGVARDVDHLVDLVPKETPPLVHLRGAVTRGDLAERLTARGLTVTEAVVYRQSEVPLTQEALGLLAAGPTLVPLYSPRSATLLAGVCPPKALPHLRLLALSPAVAAACPVPPVAISETPDGKAMLRLLSEQFSAIDG